MSLFELFFKPKEKYRPNAAVIVSDGNGKVLLCRRLGKRTTYQTVQGGIDKGETAEQAARRELQEELGLKPNQFEITAALLGKHRYSWARAYRKSIPHPKYVGQEQEFFLAVVSKKTKFDLDAHHREFEEVYWGTPEELIKKSWRNKRPILRKALKGFGLI